MTTASDNSHSFSEPYKLLAGESIVAIKHYPNTINRLHKPSSLKEIYRLTSAQIDSEVGSHGPALAALPYDSDGPVDEHQGIYSAVFGRDSLRVAIDLAEYYPKLTEVTLLRLAELQGLSFHTEREEEPGRIVHEARNEDDPIARKISDERGWGWPYYGSVDATPEFVRTLSRYCKLHHRSHYDFLLRRYHDLSGQECTIADALQRAVAWIEQRLDANTEGILEYKSVLPNGIENQVWKDSWDAYQHADGSLANTTQPIASIEVQVTTYDALIDAAELYESVLSNPAYAERLRERAHKLAETIERYFWVNEKDGYYALGTDRDDAGQLRQLKVRTSNMGHVLNSRLLKGLSEHAVNRRFAVLAQLKSPEMLAQAGIRTLASDEVRYREGSYQNGSVWIWDTHHIAKGCRRQSEQEFKDFAIELDRRILNVVDTIGGFPEYVRGSANDIVVNEYVIDIADERVGSSRVDLQACKLEYSIVSPK